MAASRAAQVCQSDVGTCIRERFTFPQHFLCHLGRSSFRMSFGGHLCVCCNPHHVLAPFCCARVLRHALRGQKEPAAAQAAAGIPLLAGRTQFLRCENRNSHDVDQSAHDAPQPAFMHFPHAALRYTCCTLFMARAAAALRQRDGLNHIAVRVGYW